MLLIEYPHASEKIVMLARKDGVYQRPIMGAFIDVRIEDFMPLAKLGITSVNFVAKLPNSRKYLVSTFNTIQTIDATEEIINILLSKTNPINGKPVYVKLPSNPDDEYWNIVRSPWWEWAAVFDYYDGYIKAPKKSRHGEPNAEEIDEKLDEFPENRGKIEVLSPTTLQHWQTTNVTENYQKRIYRI
jgi:hypothetical protein